MWWRLAETGNLSLPDDLPAELAGDGEFWTYVIKQNSLFWKDLPTEFEGDSAFARVIDRFCDQKLVEDVFSRFPFLANERNMWFGVIASFQGECALQPLIRDHAPDHIRRDKELMVLACKNDCDVLRELPGTDLLRDRDILEAALEESRTALWLIPESSQCLFPDLVVRAFSNYDGDDFNDCSEVVAKPLWANMDVCRAWVESLGDVHSLFPESMKSNAEFGLLVARHLDVEDIEDFEVATSVALRSDKTFMLSAVGIDAKLFKYACGGLNRDFDLTILAYGSDEGPDFVNRLLDDDNREEKLSFLQQVWAEAEAKLEAHDGFTRGLLCGMSHYAGSECHLPMLAHGSETSLALKQLIADFAGVPRGKQLRRLRQASLPYLPSHRQSDDDSSL